MADRPNLDPVILKWLRRIQELSASIEGTDERHVARLLSDSLFDEFGIWDPTGVTRTTRHLTTAHGPLRIDDYRPTAPAPGPTPAYLNLHGGSFRLGELDERVNVALCTSRARDTGYATFSLDYRLAPDHPHPAALQDATDALRWLLKNADRLGIDAKRIIIGGVSAGGGIAAALGQRARDEGLPVAGQLLEVPVVDIRDDGFWDEELATLNGFGSLADLRGGYASAEGAHDPGASPILGDLRGLAPAHVMTAEHDPLRVGANEYVKRLAAAGNRVSTTCHPGQLHGTQNLNRAFGGARAWHAEVVATLKELATAPAESGRAAARQ